MTTDPIVFIVPGTHNVDNKRILQSLGKNVVCRPYRNTLLGVPKTEVKRRSFAL